MSIAATFNSNYAGLSLGISNKPAAPPGERAGIIAEIVGRILQPTSNSTTSAPPANASAAIILTQLLASTKLFDSTNGAALMELNLNQLLNSSVLQKALTQLPPELLAKPQVIEALVLQNTLLPATTSKELPALPLLTLPSSTPTTTPEQIPNTLYRINVQWQNKLIQLLSPQPLPTGTRVPLQIDARGTIALLRPEVAAKILLAQTSAAQTTQPPQTESSAALSSPQPGQRLAPLPSLAANLPSSALRATSTPLPTTAETLQLNEPLLATTSPARPSAPTAPIQTIQQSLRELLPRQQALHTLVPLLQKFIVPGVREQLPKPVFKALAQLLQSLPKPAQLRSAENVRQAINNNGSFLEAKIARAATAAPNAEPWRDIAASDLKAQINTLLALLGKHAPQSEATAKSSVPPASPQFNAEDDFVYTKPSIHASPNQNAAISEHESLDSLLSQLGKLLQSGFARIQLNQLDSMSARHATHESQIPVPTWVIELPLRTPHGVDQLQLRIEQRRKQHQQRTRVQWNVEIAFDLHSAGKLAASLAIVEKSVSATLWAEQEQTHRRVREEMDYLRAGLESVGVKVTEMQCRLGLPAPRTNPISQQLVDIHT